MSDTQQIVKGDYLLVVEGDLMGLVVVALHRVVAGDPVCVGLPDGRAISTDANRDGWIAGFTDGPKNVMLMNVEGEAITTALSAFLFYDDQVSRMGATPVAAATQTRH